MNMMRHTVARERRSIVDRIPAAVMIGLISTTVMTVVMDRLYRALPHDEQFPLPPEEITTVAEAKVLGALLDDPQHSALTLINHFGYGTTLGAVYVLLSERLPLPPLFSSVLYGVTVWAGSYLGWLPALRILRPATEFSPARNSLLIISHLVWGVALGALTNQFQNRDTNS
jgi:uncharacterized membrane protein YagU involved in acid resistance